MIRAQSACATQMRLGMSGLALVFAGRGIEGDKLRTQSPETMCWAAHNALGTVTFILEAK